MECAFISKADEHSSTPPPPTQKKTKTRQNRKADPMKVTTIDAFKPELLPFSHPGNLTPAEATRLSLALVEVLSEDVCDRFFLKFSARFLTKDLYKEVIEERNINRYCGYPLCQQHQARIDNSPNARLRPYSYLSSFCSKRHFQCSEFFSTQLSSEALFARKDVTVECYGSSKMRQYETNTTLLEEVLDEYDKKATQGQQTSIMDIVRQLDSLSLGGEKKKNHEDIMDSMGKMLEDIKIVEKDPSEPPVPPTGENAEDTMDAGRLYEYLQDQSKAIDGYVLNI